LLRADKDKFTFIDQWGHTIATVNKNIVYEFMQGNLILFDCRQNKWNWLEQSQESLTHKNEIIKFLEQ
jgi:hypothetical protein